MGTQGQVWHNTPIISGKLRDYLPLEVAVDQKSMDEQKRVSFSAIAISDTALGEIKRVVCWRGRNHRLILMLNMNSDSY
jgi:hypothetical protein